MKVAKKISLTLFLITSFSSVSLCQIFTPVKWQFGSKKINDNEAVIFAKATMNEGWHIYSLNVPDGGPIKTAINFEPDISYKLAGRTLEPKPKTKYEEVFDLDVPYFEDEVVFQQKIKLEKQGKIKVSGLVSFSACDAERCLPEDEVEFVITIQ